MQWMTHTPEGSFATVCNGDRYAEMIRSQGGENALKQWKQLEDKMRPLQQGAALFPAAALRSDPGNTSVTESAITHCLKILHLLQTALRVLQNVQRVLGTASIAKGMVCMQE